jgi:hypothetical protein
MILNRRLSGPVLALFSAALAAAPASARPIDWQPTPTQTRIVEVSTGEGFDWRDAEIGAGAMLAATGLAATLVLSIRRRHGRAGTTA